MNLKLKKVLKLPQEEQEELFWSVNVVKEIKDFKTGFDNYKYIPLGEHIYKQADYIKRLFFEGSLDSLIESVTLMYSIKKDDVFNLEFRIFIRCLKTIKQEIEKDLEEQQKLEVFSDEKVKLALAQSNSDIMNQFGIYNTIDNLSKGDKSKWEYFENLKYHKVKFMIAYGASSNFVGKKFDKVMKTLNNIENG